MTPKGTQRSAPTSKRSFWIELEQPAQSLGQAGIGEHHTESSVQLVDGAERTDAAVELGNARAVAERGLAAVAGARVDAREPNRLVAVPRAHRLLQIGTKPALRCARNAGSVERSGWWVETPTRVGVFTRVRVYIKGDRHRATSARSVRPRIERAITRRWISLVPS